MTNSLTSIPEDCFKSASSTTLSDPTFRKKSSADWWRRLAWTRSRSTTGLQTPASASTSGLWNTPSKRTKTSVSKIESLTLIQTSFESKLKSSSRRTMRWDPTVGQKGCIPRWRSWHPTSRRMRRRERSRKSWSNLRTNDRHYLLTAMAKATNEILQKKLTKNRFS